MLTDVQADAYVQVFHVYIHSFVYFAAFYRNFILVVAALLVPLVACNDNLLNITDLANCPYQVEPIECYQDKAGYKKRSLPNEILNSRDIYSDFYRLPRIQWRNYKHWLSNFICECAKKLFQYKKDAKSDYIGMQFYGECWANLESKLTKFDNYGPSENCIDHTYKPFKKTSKCGLYMGQQHTSFVYKVSKHPAVSCLDVVGDYEVVSKRQQYSVKANSNILQIFKGNSKLYSGEIMEGCKGVVFLDSDSGVKHSFEYKVSQCKLIVGSKLVLKKKDCKQGDIPCPRYKSRGCWKDPFPRKAPSKRPMHVYAMNERDPYALNWNKRLIDWKRWGKGYLAGLLCRCAKVAKKTNMKYFSIQFYGECWTGNQSDFNKYGRVTSCVDEQWRVCPRETDNQCLSPICAGKWETNKVYEIEEEKFEKKKN